MTAASASPNSQPRSAKKEVSPPVITTNWAKAWLD
jgi:hypothetical protein